MHEISLKTAGLVHRKRDQENHIGWLQISSLIMIAFMNYF